MATPADSSADSNRSRERGATNWELGRGWAVGGGAGKLESPAPKVRAEPRPKIRFPFMNQTPLCCLPQTAHPLSIRVCGSEKGARLRGSHR